MHLPEAQLAVRVEPGHLCCSELIVGRQLLVPVTPQRQAGTPWPHITFMKAGPLQFQSSSVVHIALQFWRASRGLTGTLGCRCSSPAGFGTAHPGDGLWPSESSTDASYSLCPVACLCTARGRDSHQSHRVGMSPVVSRALALGVDFRLKWGISPMGKGD